MGELRSFDVIVVGGGPGGSMTAKRCAEIGFNTLLIEKKKLPRDKVCTGMVMGDWAARIIRQELGQIPERVLVDPPALVGHRFYVAGAEVQSLEWHTPLTWRKHLDYWMVQRAKASGAVVRESTRVAHINPEEGACRVTTREGESMETLKARFVIGADGGASMVRRSIFPKLKVRYSGPIRECYRGALDMEKEFIHWFFPKGRFRPRFNVNHKNDVFLIEGAGIRELRGEVLKTLSPYGFHPHNGPEWKDGCPIAHLHGQLLSRAFEPATGNILLVGDAAGLTLPITFEGIGVALKSGLLAAEATMKSAETGVQAEFFYLQSLKTVLETIRQLYALQDELNAASDGGPDHLAESLLAAYRETLTIQQP